ncbi:SPOR domain-containing protein [Antarcticimicrobium sediminis]|nr:SPOR domain-containing protein [Antarcticimicrobium sediminis]
MSALCAQAQSLRNASPPAEFPSASYTGKQYVDSQGCIYIRAGIDGNVTWVPRVGRDRKQVCGYKPTVVAGGAAAAKPRAQAPVEITLPATTQPAAIQKPKPLPAAVAQPVAKPRTAPVAQPRRAPVQAAAPAPIATPAPIRVRRAPAATTVVIPAPRRQAAPQAAPVIAPRKAPAQAGGGCSNASAFSQQFINKGAGVRCGPQAEPPITYGRGGDRQSVLMPRGARAHMAVAAVSPETRVVPRHVYDRRRNTTSVSVPDGYKPVWSDDRLNPHRAERSLRPAQPRAISGPPRGYLAATRDDDRLNTRRGPRTAQGDARTDRIWTRTVPRELVPQPTDRQIVIVPKELAKSPAEAERAGLLRISTRNAPVTAGAPRVSVAPGRYVRVATYGSDQEARQVAQALAQDGLPMRLGSVRRGQATHRVVLAGPFADSTTAQAALRQARAAGFSGAHLN